MTAKPAWAKFWCDHCQAVEFSLVPAIEVDASDPATLAVLCPQCGNLHEQPVNDEAVIVLLDGGASLRWSDGEAN